MAEPELQSKCCDAPVRKELGLGGQGIVHVAVCTKCERRCWTRNVWNGLPPIGTFEQQLGTPFREPFGGR